VTSAAIVIPLAMINMVFLESLHIYYDAASNPGVLSSSDNFAIEHLTVKVLVSLEKTRSGICLRC